MERYKKSKWATELIGLQQADGSWGDFHTLSSDSESQITTENALRRLQALGFTIDDLVIEKAISYIHDCLLKKQSIRDRREKSHPWDIFCDLMFAAWIRRFSFDFPTANEVAEKWAYIMSAAFNRGDFDLETHKDSFKKIYGEKMYGPRFYDVSNFYFVSLFVNLLPSDIEQAFIDYILANPRGIYYLGYEGCLNRLPDEFGGKKTVRYLASMEILSPYQAAQSQLGELSDWLTSNVIQDRSWDLGVKSRDNIHLPLSDSWRKKEDRIADCTFWINRILSAVRQG